jgi:putative colanic acid biosynthesis UDP-glucose lipid carrier transferase
MGFATKTTDNYSRLVFITWACLSPIAMNVALVYFSKKPLIKEPITHRRVRAVIAGWSPSCVDVTNLINRSPGLDMNILGYFDFDAQHENNNQNLRFLGSFDDLINDARDGSYHLVYLNLQSEHMHMVTELTRELANSTVSVYWMIPDDLTEVTLAPRVHDFGERHAISLHEIPFTQWQVKLKRIEDVVLSSIILILIAVPMAIIALLIKILALRCFMWTEGGKIPA